MTTSNSNGKIKSVKYHEQKNNGKIKSHRTNNKKKASKLKFTQAKNQQFHIKNQQKNNQLQY